MDDENTNGKTTCHLEFTDEQGFARAEADRAAREIAGQAGTGGRVRAAGEIVALIARTGYLSRLVAERLPDAEAVRYEAGSVALDRGWAPGLAAGVKELLAADVPGFRAEVAGCLAEELTRLAPAAMDLDRIAHGDQGTPVSACAWAAGLVRSRHSGVWKTAVRQAVRSAKASGGLLPPDDARGGGCAFPVAKPSRLELAATYRPLWRGCPAAGEHGPGEVTEDDDARTDDVCDSMKRQPDEYRLHLGAYQMTALLRTPPVARSESAELFGTVRDRDGQEAVREALRALAGEDGSPSRPVDEDALRRMFGHWTVRDLRAVTEHDGALSVIRILVSAAVTRVKAMRDADARASAPALMAALRARLTADGRARFEEAVAGWTPSRLVSFALAVNASVHEPRGERQRERAEKFPPEVLAAEAGVDPEALASAAYEVLVRRMLDSVPSGRADVPAGRAEAA